MSKASSPKLLNGGLAADIVESQRMVLRARFSNLYFAKLINYLVRFGVVLVGTNISNDEYFVCTKKLVIYHEAERISLSKFNYKTNTKELFIANIKEQYNPNFESESTPYKLEDIFNESEVVLLMDNHLRNIPINLNMQKYFPFIRPSEMLIPYLLRKGIIDEIYPQHNPFTLKPMWHLTKTNLYYPVGADLCNYFGQEVAFYFEWISFYWQWLFYPAALGILILIYSLIIGEQKTMDQNPLVPIYSSFMILWGFFFTKYWRRRQSTLSYEWDTVGKRKGSNIRSEYYGNRVFNEVTGEYRIYFPRSKRRIRFVGSAIVIVFMASIAFFFIICSFNLRGFIGEKTYSGSENMFYIETLSRYSHKNAILSPMGPLFFVPVIMHSSFLYIMNSIIFKNIALRLTEWENHETESDFLYYLILKRFIFDSFDSYCGLFYLAFYEFDSEKLRIVLHGVFISDNVRRIVLKCLLPWVLLKVKRQTDIIINRTKHSSRSSLVEYWNSMATNDSYMAIYDSFDDYLEMVIEFGYISLFASVSLVTAVIALITNLIDKKTDCMKLLFLFKRPLVSRANATGPWVFIISFLTYLSVITNTFIFGVTSGQMMHWLPSYFVAITGRKKNKFNTDRQFIGHSFQSGSGHIAVGFLVLIEHFFILIGLFIHFNINSLPRDVRRQMYEHDVLMSKAYINNLKTK